MEVDPWEDRTLNLLEDSKIDQELSAGQKKGGKKKHKLKWMTKRPMAIPDVILEFFDENLRENALRALSTFLVERRKEDPEHYKQTGYFIFNSCATMTILLQEVLNFYMIMHGNIPNSRPLKRLVNVLTLFQCVAANTETRMEFVECQIPYYLIPIILFKCDVEIYDNIRAIALSVFGILCQVRDTKIIKWALDNNMVEVCSTVTEIGNELAKVIRIWTYFIMEQLLEMFSLALAASRDSNSWTRFCHVKSSWATFLLEFKIAMHILESILLSGVGKGFLCHPENEEKLKELVLTWNNMVFHLRDSVDFSPRLLYHIMRCYAILCTHPRGLEITVQYLPDDLINNSFHEAAEEFPILKDLLDQLLLCVGVDANGCVQRKYLIFLQQMENFQVLE